jgi:hypothetical protein
VLCYKSRTRRVPRAITTRIELCILYCSDLEGYPLVTDVRIRMGSRSGMWQWPLNDIWSTVICCTILNIVQAHTLSVNVYCRDLAAESWVTDLVKIPQIWSDLIPAASSQASSKSASGTNAACHKPVGDVRTWLPEYVYVRCLSSLDLRKDLAERFLQALTATVSSILVQNIGSANKWTRSNVAGRRWEVSD